MINIAIINDEFKKKKFVTDLVKFILVLFTMNESDSYILVTGAGSGIGKEIALLLGKQYKVICISKSSKCEKTADLIGDNATSLIVDFNNLEKSADTLKNFIEKNKISISALVHCAGIIGEKGPLEETTIGSWNNAFNVNFFSSVMLAQLIIPVFKKQKFGKLIYFSGGGGAYGYSVLPQYSASKTALIRFVENLEMELTDFYNIESVIIAPGAVKTEMFNQVLEKEKEYGRTSELRTFTKIIEITSFIEYLIKNNFKMISGRLVHIRDNWKEILDENIILDDSFWKLKRVEE